MNHRLYSCCAALLLTIAPVAVAYSPADLQTLATTNRCVGCDLSGANLSRKQLVNADLQAANLVGANLSGANLTNAKLGGANLTGANLTSTNLTGAVLQAASLIDVNFDSTNLTRTDLSYANLVKTNFSSAILANTELSGANLALADFTGANLTNSSFTNANLSGARGITPVPAPPTPTDIPNVTESSPAFKRPPIYRLPPGLGSPKRLVPGGTRNSASPNEHGY
jgi:uncharacterized protein YjbI with pentapeptide repeats